MAVKSFSFAKIFGIVGLGAMFAGTECYIEGANPLRSSHDVNY